MLNLPLFIPFYTIPKWKDGMARLNCQRTKNYYEKMDSITQAVLGAAIGEAVLGNKIGHKGAIIGAVIATIPDLDVMLYLFYDSFDMLSIHRGVSHSIVFSLIGASLIAYVMSKIKWTSEIKYKTLWILAWLALFTHILLDTFTAYGTQLLLPFSDKRIGFDSINIVDPIYTVPLIIGLALSLFVAKNSMPRGMPNTWGLIISSAYLLLTLGVKQQVNNHFKEELTKQNISYQSLLTVPVGIASISWYGVAKTEDSLYMHKYSIIEDKCLPFEVFPINDHLLSEINPKIAHKMKWFAKGFYTLEKSREKIRIYNLQVDMRGIVNRGHHRAPTVGYFEVSNINSKHFEFSSGSLKD